MEQEFEYERRKSRLQENEALLKREERWLHSELVGMNKQRDELINENIEIQRQLYAEIEKERTGPLHHPLFEQHEPFI